MVKYVGDCFACEFDIEPANERPVTTGLDDGGAVHPQRRIHTVVGMTAQENVDALLRALSMT